MKITISTLRPMANLVQIVTTLFVAQHQNAHINQLKMCHLHHGRAAPTAAVVMLKALAQPS